MIGVKGGIYVCARSRSWLFDLAIVLLSIVVFFQYINYVYKKSVLLLFFSITTILWCVLNLGVVIFMKFGLVDCAFLFFPPFCYFDEYIKTIDKLQYLCLLFASALLLSASLLFRNDHQAIL